MTEEEVAREIRVRNKRIEDPNYHWPTEGLEAAEDLIVVARLIVMWYTDGEMSIRRLKEEVQMLLNRISLRETRLIEIAEDGEDKCMASTYKEEIIRYGDQIKELEKSISILERLEVD